MISASPTGQYVVELGHMQLLVRTAGSHSIARVVRLDEEVTSNVKELIWDPLSHTQEHRLALRGHEDFVVTIVFDDSDGEETISMIPTSGLPATRVQWVSLQHEEGQFVRLAMWSAVPDLVRVWSDDGVDWAFQRPKSAIITLPKLGTHAILWRQDARDVLTLFGPAFASSPLHLTLPTIEANSVAFAPNETVAVVGDINGACIALLGRSSKVPAQLTLEGVHKVAWAGPGFGSIFLALSSDTDLRDLMGTGFGGVLVLSPALTIRATLHTRHKGRLWILKSNDGNTHYEATESAVTASGTPRLYPSPDRALLAVAPLGSPFVWIWELREVQKEHKFDLLDVLDNGGVPKTIAWYGARLLMTFAGARHIAVWERNSGPYTAHFPFNQPITGALLGSSATVVWTDSEFGSVLDTISPKRASTERLSGVPTEHHTVNGLDSPTTRPGNRAEVADTPMLLASMVAPLALRPRLDNDPDATVQDTFYGRGSRRG